MTRYKESIMQRYAPNQWLSGNAMGKIGESQSLLLGGGREVSTATRAEVTMLKN